MNIRDRLFSRLPNLTPNEFSYTAIGSVIGGLAFEGFMASVAPGSLALKMVSMGLGFFFGGQLGYGVGKGVDAAKYQEQERRGLGYSRVLS